MINAELKQQPRSAHEEYSNVTDSDADGDSQLATMRSERETQLAKLRTATRH